MKIRNLLGFIGLGFFIITSCDDRPKLMDTPTSGLITVLVDETYKPLMDSEKMVFEAQYPEAKINLVYKPALDILDQMDNDSFRAYFTAAPVDSNLLRGFYERKKYFPKSIFIAKDAIALIANNQKKGLKISVDEFAKICRGEITDYSELKGCKHSGKITLVFDNAKSSTVQYIQDSVLKGGLISNKTFALQSNPDVMDYVTKNSGALGVIGANWISDNADIETLKFTQSIYTVEVGKGENPAYFYTPHPGYIATHMYPMRRLMIVTLKENGAALGRGFVNFITGDIGQKIVLKSGIVPAKAITRVVETRNKL
jgi:phosphate transport system substrate-binding protein